MEKIFRMGKHIRIVLLLIVVVLSLSACKADFLQKSMYPIKYGEFVEKYSAEYDLDKYLVYAVIKAESKFNPEVVSNAGAIGLMQLMENTATECNKKEGFGYSIPEDLTNPETNIRIGCCYLRELYDRYGDMRLAVAAYNAGKGNVDNWLKDEDLADGEGGLKEIPFEETKKYVEKVFEYHDAYIEIYEQE